MIEAFRAGDRIDSAEDTILTFIARDEENEKFRLLILLMCNYSKSKISFG